YECAIVDVESYDGHAIKNCVVFTSFESKLTPGARSYPCSQRYKQLLVDGSAKSGLDPEYQAKLQALPVAPSPRGIDKWLTKQKFDFHHWVCKAHEFLPTRFGRLLQKIDEVIGEWTQKIAGALMGTPFTRLVVLLFVPYMVLVPLVNLSTAVSTALGRMGPEQPASA
ncbi:hypothetical protein CYMTET_25460, partial [Cymbomonas tetramitiformis]